MSIENKFSNKTSKLKWGFQRITNSCAYKNSSRKAPMIFPSLSSVSYEFVMTQMCLGWMISCGFLFVYCLFLIQLHIANGINMLLGWETCCEETGSSWLTKFRITLVMCATASWVIVILISIMKVNKIHKQMLQNIYLTATKDRLTDFRVRICRLT